MNDLCLKVDLTKVAYFGNTLSIVGVYVLFLCFIYKSVRCFFVDRIFFRETANPVRL